MCKQAFPTRYTPVHHGLAIHDVMIGVFRWPMSFGVELLFEPFSHAKSTSFGCSQKEH